MTRVDGRRNRPPRPPTERQLQALDVVKRSIAERGYPPTVREIGDALSITPNAVVCIMDALEKKGRIRRTSYLARAITVLA